MAYYILKTVREPLILLAGGAELKSYAAAAQALALIAYVPLYGWVAQKLPRQRFLAAVILFFVGCIQLFYLGSRAGRAPPGVRLLRLGGHLQPDHDRPVLVVRERDLHASRGRPALPADRHRLDGRRAARRGARRAAVRPRAEPVPDDGDRGRDPARCTSSSTAWWRARMASRPGPAGRGADQGRQRLRPRAEEPLPAARRAAPRAPQHRQHGRRVHPGAGRGRAAPTRSARSTPRFDKEAYIGAFYGNYFLLDEHRRDRRSRRSSSRASSSASACAGRSSRCRSWRFCAYGTAAAGAALGVLLYVKIAENTHRLLGDEHGEADDLAAHEPRGEVQGQAGDRHLLRARGRHARRRASSSSARTSSTAASPASRAST